MNELAREVAQLEAEKSAWAASMPASVFPYRQEMFSPGFDPPELMRQLSQALNDGEPDDARRIRALLSWYAGGSGRFSFYPAYESYPEVLLLDEEPGALLAAVSAPDLTAAELAGAARLVAICLARHRSEFDSLPPAAWDRLIAAAAEGGDEDKRDCLARGRADRECSRE